MSQLLDWHDDCLLWRKRVLTGVFAHWCYDWDDLPVDETTPFEFECCSCFPREVLATYEYQAGPFIPAPWPDQDELGTPWFAKEPTQ